MDVDKSKNKLGCLYLFLFSCRRNSCCDIFFPYLPLFLYTFKISLGFLVDTLGFAFGVGSCLPCLTSLGSRIRFGRFLIIVTRQS